MKIVNANDASQWCMDKNLFELLLRFEWCGSKCILVINVNLIDE